MEIQLDAAVCGNRDGSQSRDVARVLCVRSRDDCTFVSLADVDFAIFIRSNYRRSLRLLKPVLLRSRL